MKIKHVVLFMIVCLLSGIASGQDKIIKKDGTIILAKVVACTDQGIQYMRVVADMDGQIYVDESAVNVIAIDKVESVQLASGRILYQEQKQDHAQTTSAAISNPHIYPRYKSPALAFVGSLILPGLGQMYNDEVGKGLCFIGADGFLIGVAALTLSAKNIDLSGFAYACIVAIPILHLVAPIEAAFRAETLNNMHGYIAISPTIQQSYFAANSGEAHLVPGLAVSLHF